MQGEPGIILSGIRFGSNTLQDTFGWYWQPTSENGSNKWARGFYINADRMDTTQDTEKFRGCTIRCIVR